uniref:Uncharacterized protein n=1 Tax=Oryza sativa subsp. japonica TaxID=39947 RepID=Q653M4_ORYSJ|nr:hypothetical protein [Oryza sativa Japonica Group]
MATEGDVGGGPRRVQDATAGTSAASSWSSRSNRAPSGAFRPPDPRHPGRIWTGGGWWRQPVMVAAGGGGWRRWRGDDRRTTVADGGGRGGDGWRGRMCGSRRVDVSGNI